MQGIWCNKVARHGWWRFRKRLIWYVPLSPVKSTQLVLLLKGSGSSQGATLFGSAHNEESEDEDEEVKDEEMIEEEEIN